MDPRLNAPHWWTTRGGVRAWLATGTRRAGDRLPPELELAGMLGVSRGTLRTALDRLEEAGEITRRQGSGTYVGQAVRPTAFHEGLEVLRPYSQLAERRGVALTVRDLVIEEQPIGAGRGGRVRPPARDGGMTVTRTILADGNPSRRCATRCGRACCCRPRKRLSRAIEGGSMVLDVLLEQGVQVAFAVTHVRPCMISGREPEGRALGVDEPTAVLELEEIMHLGRGRPCSTRRTCSRRWDRPAGAPQPGCRGPSALVRSGTG